MHEMQTIVTDVSGVCPSICLTRGSLGGARAVCTGSFGGGKRHDSAPHVTAPSFEGDTVTE